MDNNESIDKGAIEQAHELVAALESGDKDQAMDLLDSMTRLRETELFKEVGRLTRQLHDTLVSFQMDSKLSHLATRDMPDAKEHLNNVINMTESSAHKTMSAIESTIPICEGLENRATELREKWERFMSRDLTVDEFRELARELGAFLSFAERESGTIKTGLNEILIAQDFQDLTGQTIRRVINLVQEVEESLVGMIKLSDYNMSDAQREEKSETREGSKSMASQDDVDDLLSSLGF
jgi:chemotaxis protein CheZ